MSKNIEKQEPKEIAHGLITTYVREETQTCSYCTHDRQEVKGCYVQPKEKFCITETTEEKEVNTDQEETFSLILSNMTKRPVNLQEKRKVDRRLGSYCTHYQ